MSPHQGRSESPPEQASSDRSAFQGFHHRAVVSQDVPTPRALSDRTNDAPLSSPSTVEDSNEGMNEGDDADFQSHYSLGAHSSPGSAGSESDHGDQLGEQRPFLHRSTSSFLIANAFAPPFYNRPPAPLPPSPSLTSLLRPSFSTTTSRPTTPDSSENDTPNDTEAAVAKSARTATTVPRASPKVPTYEYYGFVLYLLSSLIFRTYPWYPRYPQITVAKKRSHVPSVVLSTIAILTPTGDTLLSKSLVVSGHSILPGHDNNLYIRGPCFI